MKKILSILSLLALSACSHYMPVSQGTGEYSGKEVKGCGAYIFGIPSSTEESRIDKILEKNNLTNEDIYSVNHLTENKFLWLIAKSCTIISVNKGGVSKLPEETVPQWKKEEQMRKANEAKVYKDAKTVSDCGKYSSKERYACKKAFFNHKK